ncbi:xylulokinase [Fundicoccus sp. Sow4_D5]|uniref:xylulokinase n=1 Tax=Fundicoccus sp. Sow4_D5 TaxID=3438782 RepID=UPI003F925E39
MTKEAMKQILANRETSLGIELGSTRVKAVLINKKFQVIASGESQWENELSDAGFWTYGEDLIWQKLQEAYAQLKAAVKEQYQHDLTGFGSLGFSAMMHGYIALDKSGELLVPFRTWRNGNTDQATKVLSELFSFNIPHRWSVAHLYQAMLDKERHVVDIDQLTTLAGYVHWKLTGKRVLGIGDASGMFPIDSQSKQYKRDMLTAFNQTISQLGYTLNIEAILPKVLVAGEAAGQLTSSGARLLDPSGQLEAGIPLAPPEGDAGTGMVATNAVEEGTANVSAGTSAFAMVVLDKELKAVYPEIDIVTTPAGADVAMVHINNCTSEINYWLSMFEEVFETMGVEVSTNDLYEKLFNKSQEADADAGQMVIYGFHSGENSVQVEHGRPMLVRNPNGRFNLANFMQANLNSAFASMKFGMNILLEKENIQISNTVAHGGIFKTPLIAQKVLASVMQSSVTVMETAGEGGAWGMAVLAAYLHANGKLDLAAYLNQEVFQTAQSVTVAVDIADTKAYVDYIDAFEKALPLQQTAAKYL